MRHAVTWISSAINHMPHFCGTTNFYRNQLIKMSVTFSSIVRMGPFILSENRQLELNGHRYIYLISVLGPGIFLSIQSLKSVDISTRNCTPNPKYKYATQLNVLALPFLPPSCKLGQNWDLQLHPQEPHVNKCHDFHNTWLAPFQYAPLIDGTSSPNNKNNLQMLLLQFRKLVQYQVNNIKRKGLSSMA